MTKRSKKPAHMPLTTERIARVGGGPDAVTRHDSCPHIRAALERQPAVPLGNVTACWAVHTHASARLSQDMALHGWSTRPDAHRALLYLRT
eukprot:CAMPEP_0181210748 /NCGR_PEP_ID=MMETSP1096-20121128/23406_1 /TAXON_ID=156174 ORGANISM="Chrysochromulina ericina, Strain CCMP281" /NCGR_SAMPLE_ID=MMETSP1096 /ASSEMBLY_ACC=CAM_ASM_000453 /LENGTH=90 /DNA_ID=CAMNT_0023302079 /DNA_START=716 /DNA_END=988 /DNA_ORIENTATION=-